MVVVFRVADGAPFQGSVMRLHISGHHEWGLFFQCLITSPTGQFSSLKPCVKPSEILYCQLMCFIKLIFVFVFVFFLARLCFSSAYFGKESRIFCLSDIKCKEVLKLSSSYQ